VGGAACFGVVSTAFKFLLLKFMSAKVIFHLVFPAAHLHHPSKCFFFPAEFSFFLIVSLWVFALFRLLFMDTTMLVTMATGVGYCLLPDAPVSHPGGSGSAQALNKDT